MKCFVIWGDVCQLDPGTTVHPNYCLSPTALKNTIGKQLQSIEITPNIELQITLSGLKIRHLKLKTKPLHPISATSDHWTEQILHKNLEVPSSGFHLLQMLIFISDAGNLFQLKPFSPPSLQTKCFRVLFLKVIIMLGVSGWMWNKSFNCTSSKMLYMGIQKLK